MCGIAGFVNPKVKDKKTVIKKMADRIAYRGPDGEGYYIDSDVALAHRRLSIIDLHTGGQPQYNEDRTMAIVFNGEIYNFQEIKEELVACGHVFSNKSDTEVILHGYEEWGKHVVDHLRGMFAFAIWDTHTKSLFLARDPFGIKPLYYTLFDGNFLFGSEIKCFLDYPGFHKELNQSILSAYLCFNSTPTEETFFQGVYRLEPGCSLLYQDGKLTKEKYFSIQFEESNDSMEECASKISEALKNSVEYHQIADVEVGSFLSSGIDSSYLVSLAKPDHTFTVGYDNPKYDEISYAKDLASKLGISNKSRQITKEEYMEAFPNIMYHMDEPLADPSAIALYFVAEIASKDVKVVMSGEGADELFGGYLSYREELDQAWYMKIPYPIRHLISKVAGLFPEARGFNFLYRRGLKLSDYHIGLGRVFRDKEAMHLVRAQNQVSTKEIMAPLYQEYASSSTMVQRQMVDFYYWLVRDFLHAVDRNTMMFGLEARTPFLDKEVLEVARHLPTSAKINAETTKPALRKAASKVIPNESYKKKKLGFPVPLREWIREEDVYLKIKEAFLSEEAATLFHQKRILKLLEDHKSGKKDTYKKVWTIYTFLVWYNQFFKEA